MTEQAKTEAATGGTETEKDPAEPQLSPELQSLKDAAIVAKAQAEAEQAKANAAKAAAEALSSKAAADKARKESDDYDAPFALRQREAAAGQAVAEAGRDAAAARVEQIKALIPDLSKLPASTVEVKEGTQPLLGSALTYQALEKAAHTIAKSVVFNPAAEKDVPGKVLVTCDQDLASNDANYLDVVTGIVQLTGAAEALLAHPGVTPPAPVPGESDDVQNASISPATDVVAALASAIPTVMSLLSVQRTVSGAAVTVSDLAAAAQVAGQLNRFYPNVTFVHEDLRLIGETEVYAKEKTLNQKRAELDGRKLALAGQKTLLQATLEAAKNVLRKAIEDKQPPDVIEQARSHVAEATVALEANTLMLATIDGLTTTIDRFATAIRMPATGSRRSLLASAALHESVHQHSLFTHVLLVKAQPSEVLQVKSDRPLWWRDRFNTRVDVNVTYILIELNDSAIVSSGTTTGTAEARGTIGDAIVTS